MRTWKADASARSACRLGRLPIGRHDQRRFVPERATRQGQRPANIGQAAGLGKGDRFARGDQDVHWGFSPIGLVWSGRRLVGPQMRKVQ